MTDKTRDTETGIDYIIQDLKMQVVFNLRYKLFDKLVKTIRQAETKRILGIVDKMIEDDAMGESYLSQENVLNALEELKTTIKQSKGGVALDKS